MTSTSASSSSKEKTNYARLCRLLIDVGTLALRKTFDKFHPPANLHAALKLPRVRNVLQLLKTKKIINPTRWGNLYPAVPSSVTSANFDITLLCILLRKICSLTTPVSGWDSMPAECDVATVDDMVRLKLYRNQLNHLSNTSITEADFKSYWKGISEAVVRLGSKDFKDAIINLECETMDPEFEDHYVSLLKDWCINESSVNEKLNEIIETIKPLLERNKSFRDAGTQTEGDPSAVVRHLVDFYSRSALWIQPLSWCPTFQLPIEQIYTNLHLINREKKDSRLSDEVVGMYNIFGPTVYCSNVRKVLIEGSPGVGKTTFCRMIAYDWAKRNQILNHSTFHDFKRVIFLSCSSFESGDNFQSVIERELLPRDMYDAAKASFAQQVQEDQEGTLIILDGLDELRKEQMNPIRDIMTGEILSNCFLIVTARHEAGLNVRHYFDKLLEITGYTLSDVQEYIKKYFQEMPNKASDLINKILNKELLDIARKPMNTALLCVLFEELGGKLPKTHTELFSMITDLLLKRHACRESLNLGTLADITSTYKDKLIMLGEVAFKALHVETSDFDETEIPNYVACLGFVSKEISPIKINPQLRYCFLHKSFQEYLAALYLSEKLKSHEQDFEKTLRCVCSHNQIEKLWQVIVFAAGMLTDVDLPFMETLMKFLRPEDKVLHRKFWVILECLAEFKNKAVVASRVIPLFPTELALGDCFKSDRKFVRLKEFSFLIKEMDDTSPLKRLDVSMNELNDGDFYDRTSSFTQRNSSIQELDLSINCLGNDNLFFYSCSQILEQYTSLRHLDLSFNSIDGKGFSALINALHFINHTLSELILRGNCILFVNESFHFSAARIEIANSKRLSLKKLKKLDLSLNQNVRESTSSFHLPLSELNISPNVYNYEFFKTVTQILKFNTSLVELDLSSNSNLFKGVYEPFFSALQENNTLKILNLSNTGLPPSFAKRDNRIKAS